LFFILPDPDKNKKYSAIAEEGRMNLGYVAGNLPFRPNALAMAILVCATSVHAFQIDTGDSDIKVSWDNTVKYSAAWRLKDQSSGLSETHFDANGIAGANNINQDDGDNNFDKGLVSNRLDLFSELDIAYGDMGARVSGAGWYDSVYQGDTDNKTATSNHASANEFSDDAREVMGKKAELLDAFVYSRFSVADRTAIVRVGRHTLLWGESLFFGSNGIAGGQAPLDLVKLLSVPNSQFKEVARPIGKVSTMVPVSDNVTLGAYVGYEWQKTRLIPAGAYLSASDMLAGERINAGSAGVFEHKSDLEASDSGQYGLQLRWTLPDIDADMGLYAIRYHATSPSNIYTTMDGHPPALSASEYRWVYHEGIRAYGASIAKTVGDWSLAGEASYRQNSPLSSSGLTILRDIGVGVDRDNKNNPGYAVGRSVHAQMSWIASLGPSFISDEASFVGEIAWNARVKTDKNADMLNPNADRSATALHMVYSPTYRQVFSGFDVTPSVGIGYALGNSSAVGPAFGIDHGGSLNLGVSTVYLSRWNGSLGYVKYLGAEGPTLDNNSDAQFKQDLKDRDFLFFSLSTTF
jgi:hypothetical protein